MKNVRNTPVALAVLFLSLVLGAYLWLKHFQVTHLPVLMELRSLEVPDLSAPVVALPFCDLSVSLLKEVHSTGHDSVRNSTLEFIDGTSVWVRSALGSGPSAAPYRWQEQNKDAFLSYDKLNAFYGSLLSGLYATPWRFHSLAPDSQRVRRITPFSAQAGSGMVVESEPDTAVAFLWDFDKTRLAVLTSAQGGPSHLWEMLESWRWQERPNFPLEEAAALPSRTP